MSACRRALLARSHWPAALVVLVCVWRAAGYSTAGAAQPATTASNQLDSSSAALTPASPARGDVKPAGQQQQQQPDTLARPFYSIKDGKTSARRIQQQPRAASSTDAPNNGQPDASTSNTRLSEIGQAAPRPANMSGGERDDAEPHDAFSQLEEAGEGQQQQQAGQREEVADNRLASMPHFQQAQQQQRRRPANTMMMMMIDPFNQLAGAGWPQSEARDGQSAADEFEQEAEFSPAIGAPPSTVARADFLGGRGERHFQPQTSGQDAGALEQPANQRQFSRPPDQEEATGGQQQQAATSSSTQSPSSLSMSLDGMIVNSRPRAMSTAAADSQATAEAATTSTPASASNPISLHANSATIGHQQRPFSALNGDNSTATDSPTLAGGKRASPPPPAPLTSASKGQRRKAVPREPEQSGASGAALVGLAKGDDKESRLVMVTRATLDSLARFVDRQKQALGAAVEPGEPVANSAGQQPEAGRAQQVAASSVTAASVQPTTMAGDTFREKPVKRAPDAAASKSKPSGRQQQAGAKDKQTQGRGNFTASVKTINNANGNGRKPAERTKAPVASGAGKRADGSKLAAKQQRHDANGLADGGAKLKSNSTTGTATTPANKVERVNKAEAGQQRREKQKPNQSGRGVGKSQRPATMSATKPAGRRDESDAGKSRSSSTSSAAPASSADGRQRVTSSSAGANGQSIVRASGEADGSQAPPADRQQATAGGETTPAGASTQTTVAPRRGELDRQLDELERDQAGQDEKPASGPSRPEELEALRAAVPGEPLIDYPIFAAPPARVATEFQCAKQSCPGGYYADPEARCQVFHVCQNDGRMDTFLCPNGTIFSQQHFVCVWWWQSDCSQATKFYQLNDAIYCNSIRVPALGAAANTVPSAANNSDNSLDARAGDNATPATTTTTTTTTTTAATATATASSSSSKAPVGSGEEPVHSAGNTPTADESDPNSQQRLTLASRA